MYIRTCVEEIQEAGLHISFKDLQLYRPLESWLYEIGKLLDIPNNMDDLVNTGLYSYYRGILEIFLRNSFANCKSDLIFGKKDGEHVLEYINRHRAI